jgi:hypothetical protein
MNKKSIYVAIFAILTLSTSSFALDSKVQCLDTAKALLVQTNNDPGQSNLQAMHLCQGGGEATCLVSTANWLNSTTNLGKQQSVVYSLKACRYGAADTCVSTTRDAIFSLRNDLGQALIDALNVCEGGGSATCILETAKWYNANTPFGNIQSLQDAEVLCGGGGNVGCVSDATTWFQKQGYGRIQSLEYALETCTYYSPYAHSQSP